VREGIISLQAIIATKTTPTMIQISGLIQALRWRD
jgi:hypothetical protein